MANDNKRKLYDALSRDYDMGSYDQFCSDIDDEGKRRKLYDATSNEYDYGSWESFSKQLGYGQESAQDPSHSVVPAQSNEHHKGESETIPDQTQKKIPNDSPSSNRTMEGMLSELKLQRPGKEVSEMPESYRSRTRQEGNAVENFDDDPNSKSWEQLRQEGNRSQVKKLSAEIDSMLNDAISVSMENYRRNQEESMNGNWFQRLLSSIGQSGVHSGDAGARMISEGKKQFSGVGDLELQNRIASLNSAKMSIKNAERIIAEADHNAQSGTFLNWIESSFVGGAARGFGQKLFDASTWDMGLGDMDNAAALLAALDAFDKGEQLTDAQQVMLDAKAVELATNAYFGSYIGRGYKAGSVTAESLPFMLEMCINPASTIGDAVTSRMARYAINRFGKETAKKAGQKAIRSTVRVAADLAGAAAMTATTGAVGTAAEALERMAGDVTFDEDRIGHAVFSGHDEGESPAEAFAKAFAGRTIENYSEMVGEYFAPVLGAAGKSIGKGLDKIGLGRVTKFIDDVAASDVARVVSDFEKSAKWNGMIGEYAEEVVGSIMNALVVGDQTLDADPDTGVFNLDQNIDTFLGVSLMGGFFSAIKTAGYRSPKYEARKRLAGAYSHAESEFHGSELWDDIADEIANDPDAALHKVLTSDECSLMQRKAAIEYAKAYKEYEGALKAEHKRRTDDAADPVANDFETSFDNGYQLVSDREMNDAKNMFDYQQERLREALGIDDIDESQALQTEDLPYSADEKQIIIDYLNAKATYEGMIQRVRDDIDTRTMEADAQVILNTNSTTGMIQHAVTTDDRNVYIVGGNVVLMDDGKIDREKSDGAIIIRDMETGKKEFWDVSRLRQVDAPVDPAEQKQMTEETILRQFAQEAADKIDGVLPFNIGDTYTLAYPDGNTFDVQIVADEEGRSEYGDGFVNVESNGNRVQMKKSDIQQMYDAANLARVAEYERARAEENIMVQEAEREAQRPTFALNDTLTLIDDNGNPVRGSITADADADGKYEVYTENPINGHRVNLFTREELDSILSEHNGQRIVRSESSTEESQPAQSALQRIPKDEQGNPLYEQADSDTAWDAIVEQTEGDVDMAQAVADGMVADKEAALKKVEKAKSKGGATIAEKIASEKERAANIAAAKQELDLWKKIAGVYARRKAEEEAAERRFEEEQMRRSEMEEAELDEPHTLHEVVANTMRKMRNALDKESFKAETGMSESEMRRFFPLWAKKGSGMSVQELAERVAADGESTGLIPIDKNAEQPDVLAVRDAILDVFRGAARPSDIFKYTRRANIQRRDEMQQGWNEIEDAADDTGSIEIDGESLEDERERKLSSRIEVTDNEWEETGETGTIYKRSIIVDGVHDVTQVDIPDNNGKYNSSFFDYNDNRFGSIEEVVDFIDASLGAKLAEAEAETDTNPTDAQKAAGNYKKGHIQVGTFNVTIENPKGSVRSGVDANGKKWQTTMNNTYGYIRGTEGVDGDHIDVFLSDDIDGWDGRRVFVVDQYNTDGTFDEHKVMLGFNSEEYAIAAYMSNYEPSWADEHKTVCSSVIIDEFEKWIESSHRKTKAFADYKSVKRESDSEDVVPIGKGAFGDIYDQFRGKPQEAIRHLMKVQGGEAVGALHHKDIGEIDLVWGEEGAGKSDGYGLSKLIKYHPEVVDNLQEILDDMHIVSRSENRIKLESDTHKASVRLTWDNQEKKWLLTAFEKKEASEPIDKTTNTDDNPTEDLRGDTALSQNSNASDDKGTTISPNTNGADKKTDGYSVEKRFHKKNNTDIFAVKFTEQMSREDFLELKKRVKDFGGYYSSFGKGGFIFDTEADANRFAQAVLDKSGESLDDAAPLSLNDIAEVQDTSSAPTETADDIQALETAYADAYRKFITDNTVQSRDDARRLALDLGAAIRKNLRSEKIKFLDAQNAAIQRLKDIREKVREESSPSSSGVARQVDVEGLIGALNKTGEANLLDHSTPVSESKQESAPKNEGAFGLVSDERMDELREQLRKKILGQLNAGIDLEILSIGLQLTAGHIDRGLKKFADYAKQMIEDFGDAIRPYLKAFYNGARDLPDVVSTGLAEEMNSYDEVSRFDVANFDKNGSDPFAAAEMVVAEQEKQTQAETAKQQIIDQRNTERRKENEQTTAGTLALAEKAETVASEAGTLAETATDEREINRAVEQIDETLDQINSQLALLGFYDADIDDSKFHESYGYMLTAEKKAVKDATNLAKRLAEDLGLGIKMDKITGSTTPLGRKKGKEGTAVRANIAPAGGDITITLPLLQGRELKMYIGIAPTSAKREENYRRASHGDNLYVDSIMYRIEEPAATGLDKYGINRWVVRPEETTYDYMLQLLRGEARKFLPQIPTTESEQEQAWGDMLAMAERGESPYTVTPDVEAALAKERGAEDIFQQAARIAKDEEKKRTKRNSKKKSVSSQVELSDLFGGFTETETEKSDDNDILRRDGDPEMHSRALARDEYERRVKSGMYQSREAIQDSMLGLKEAMLAILGKKTNIEDVDGFENAYLGENRLSSVNKAEADAFAQILFKPMLDEVARLAPTEREREELTDYMMAKHGLERNRVMAERDARKAVDDGSSRSFDELLDTYRKTDYAGLTALTGLEKVDEAESEAERMVADFESSRETDDLWEKVNAVSKAILQKSYECGMMSKQTFDEVSDMYEFYIPLRGFDEKTSAEAYAYLSHKQSAFNAPIKKAQGRKSKADDPFANLQSMAESAIVQGNRNKLVKQKFLNFVLNHPSDLVSVSDLWLQYDDVSDEWRPVFPDNIDIDDTPDEVEQKMQDFEAKMSSLAEADPDTYKRGRDAVNIPYRVVESRDLRQHQVIVKRNGRDYLLTINGNPRAAQALNGQTNPDNDTSGAIGAILRAGEKINRQLSAFYTTRNPDFIVSNFVRDLLYANAMTWVKESPNYALRYHRNYITKANPAKMKSLLARYRKGQLDMSDATDAMFHQFMMNGGETGYANVRDIEQHKNDIRKELKKANGRIKIARAWDLLGEKFDELNRAIENCARFAAFITSREMGRSLDRAIYDAKEISVNFNKKGSGAKFYDANGQTVAGNGSALVSGLGRSGFVFWNAAIQGTTNFGRQFKRHPAKAYSGAAALFLLGAIVAYMGGDDDDDDKSSYYNLPEYVRRSNLLFSVGDYWISIPLPIEFRAFYGMGELMTSLFSGKEHLTDGEIAEAILGQATQVLPIDFLEGGGGLNSFVPSAVKPLWEAYVVEKGWTGMPLYKDTPYNKDMPEWTKAYSSANKYIVGLANALNESTGGDRYTKGAIDLNPAKIEYMLNGYFGGVFGTIDKLTKTAETIVGAREYDPRNVLLMNRLVKSGDERTEYRAVNKEYLRLKEEHDRIKQRLKHYEEDTDNGVFDYAEKIDFLYNSPEYERYEIFEDYRGDIDALYDELKETVDDNERKEIEAELNEVKKEMISQMNLTRKRK